MADTEVDPFAQPGLWYFEGLAVMVIPPVEVIPPPGELDFSKPENSDFEPSTGPFV